MSILNHDKLSGWATAVFGVYQQVGGNDILLTFVNKQTRHADRESDLPRRSLDKNVRVFLGVFIFTCRNGIQAFPYETAECVQIRFEQPPVRDAGGPGRHDNGHRGRTGSSRNRKPIPGQHKHPTNWSIHNAGHIPNWTNAAARVWHFGPEDQDATPAETGPSEGRLRSTPFCTHLQSNRHISYKHHSRIPWAGGHRTSAGELRGHYDDQLLPVARRPDHQLLLCAAQLPGPVRADSGPGLEHLLLVEDVQA